jgi:CRP/FNR family transcriptional regulator
MSEDLRRRLLECFPAIRRGTAELVDGILAASSFARVPRGTVIYRKGDPCRVIGLFLAGEVRVFAEGAAGREITLYEVLPGETCILNASCILSPRGYPANATAVEDTEALMLPAEAFRALLLAHEAMRDFIFSLFSDRLTLVLELIEEVTFGRLESRLAEYLVARAGNDVLHTTHQAIANDLGTSREVVSRMLKDFERAGRVSLSRSEIRLTGLSPDAPTR